MTHSEERRDDVKSTILKKKLRKSQLTVGSWITLADTAVAEIMAGSGFDWLAVDMEHSAITLDKAQELIRVIELCDIPALVRVGENDPNLIKRVMDAGAHGVIVPMVNSEADAQKAVSAVKYPPFGSRGVGLARAQGYGLGFKEYKDWVNRHSVVIVQIEHIKAVDNLQSILSVKDVDGFIVGPYDLSASLGAPGDFKSRKMREALKEVIRVARKMRKPAGFHVIQPSEKELLGRIGEGYRFLGFSLDTIYLAQACRFKLKDKRQNLKRKQ